MEKAKWPIRGEICISPEEEMRRAQKNGIPPTITSEVRYTKEGVGVDPSCDARTDTWDFAEQVEDQRMTKGNADLNAGSVVPEASTKE